MTASHSATQFSAALDCAGAKNRQRDEPATIHSEPRLAPSLRPWRVSNYWCSTFGFFADDVAAGRGLVPNGQWA